MGISFLAFRSVGAAARYDPDSMDARAIDNYMAIRTFEFGEAISEDCVACWRLA
jgi:hypothetical protein